MGMLTVSVAMIVGLLLAISHLSWAKITSLTGDNFDTALSALNVSVVHFFDSACHGCASVTGETLEEAAHVLEGRGGGVGVFEVDMALSTACEQLGFKFGTQRGSDSLRIFRGARYARAYTGSHRAQDLAKFLLSVRNGAAILSVDVERPPPPRKFFSYDEATARLSSADQSHRRRTLNELPQVHGGNKETNTKPVAPRQSIVATVESNADSTVTEAGVTNYTAEAQQLILNDNPRFIPRDPRHLGIYEYAAWHQHQVERVLDPNDPALDVKFIVFQELAKVLGFGNQVEGLLSTLMVAMLTRRVFVMDWGRDHNGVNPLELFEDLPLNCQLSTFVPHFQKVMDDNHLRTLLRKSFDPRNPNDCCMVPSPDWACSDLNEVYADPVVILKGNIYSGHILSYNPLYQDVYTFLFGDRALHNNPYASLFNWLLRPLPYILARVDEFKAANFASSDTDARTVGIHMRVRDSFLKAQSVPFFWECATSNFHLNNTVFYLATDNPLVQEEAQTTLAPATVTWYKQVGRDKQSLRADAEHRLVDILLLGSCDDLVVTCGSSYSRVAYSRADIAPLFVTYESHRWSLRHEPHQCLRAATAKPCAARYLNQINKASCLQDISPELREEIYLECDVS